MKNGIDTLSLYEQLRGVDAKTIRDLGGLPVGLDIEPADLEAEAEDALIDPKIIEAAEADATEHAKHTEELHNEKEALHAYYISYLEQKPSKIHREIALRTANNDYIAGLLAKEQLESIEARHRALLVAEQYGTRDEQEAPDWLQRQTKND